MLTTPESIRTLQRKLVIEPIFEADFCDTSYGFRPGRSAHDAIDDVAKSLNQGYNQVIHGKFVLNISFNYLEPLVEIFSSFSDNRRQLLR